MYLRLPHDAGPAHPRVMLVDDHGPLRTQLREGLTEQGIIVVAEADAGGLAVLMGPLLGPAVIVMDVRMPDLNGIETLQQLRLLGVEAPVLMFTGFPDPGIEEAARSAGAADVFVKGISIEDLAEAVRQAWKQAATQWWAGHRIV